MSKLLGLCAILVLAVLVGCSSLGSKVPIPHPAPTPQIKAALQQGVKALESNDYATAKSIFAPLAKQGYPEAQYNLGRMYELGKGVARDYDQAFDWYSKASERGYGEGSLGIASLYAWGRGVGRDSERAHQWRLKAANQGSIKGQLHVAGLYGVLSITRRSKSRQYRMQAMKWFFIAKACGAKALTGDGQTAKNFRFLKGKMAPGELTEARQLAAEWLAKHPESGSDEMNK